MLAIAAIDILGLLGILVVCGGMWYLASRIEPHWVARDRSRFMTVVQQLDEYGVPGRKRDVRVHLDDTSDALVVSSRSMLRPSSAVYMIDSKAPNPPRGRVVYRLKGVATGDTTTLMMRLPAKSKVITRLDEMLAATGASDSRESPPPDPRADRD